MGPFPASAVHAQDVLALPPAKDHETAVQGVVQLELEANGVLGADTLLIGDGGAQGLTAFPYAAGGD